MLAQVKASVPHGQWLSWLSANSEVSERQAQRYMRLAANPTRVSFSMRAALADLTKPREKRALVESGSVTIGYLGDALAFVIEESRRHPGYWYAVNVRDGSYNARPVRADGLPLAIGPLMESCDWQMRRCDGSTLVAEAA